MGRVGDDYRGYWGLKVEEHEDGRRRAMIAARIAKLVGDTDRMHALVSLAKSHHQSALAYRGFLRSQEKRR